MNISPDPGDEIIEDALQTFPMADLPAGFTHRTLSRIQTANRPTSFRLLWIDYAIGFFFSFLAGILYLIWNYMPQQFLLHLELQWQFLLSRTAQLNLINVTAIAGVVLVAVVALAAGLLILNPFSKWRLHGISSHS